MNHAAEICKAMLADSKLKLFSSICDRVGISENAGTVVMNKLCADGVLRRERDYVHVADENKARALSGSPTPAAVHSIAERKRERATPVLATVPLTITIEKGIPIPLKRWGKVAGICPWPFIDMEVGDSFAVPVPDDLKPLQVAGMLRKAATAFRRVMPGLRVTIRTEVGDKTVRLWRDPDGTPKAAPAPAMVAGSSSNGIRLPKDKRAGAAARA